MKLGINARTFTADEPGGAVQTAVRLARELATHDVEIVLFGHPSLESTFPDLAVDGRLYVRPSQGYGLLWERTVLPFLAKKHAVDALYCPNGNAPLHELSVPVVMQIHDVNALRGYSSRIHQAYRRLAVPRGASAANRVVTVSEFSKSEITSLLDVPASKVSVVYNGVDEFFRGTAASESVDLPEPYVLFVGAMNPRKNVSGLVEAFVEFTERRNVPHKLVLVGPEKDAIIRDVHIDDHADVLTPGYLTRAELRAAYANAELFVYPSLYEGFGLPPLEAMACGTPVVASNTSSLPEILGDAAVLVDPTDTAAIAGAMEAVLTNETFRGRLVGRGREQSLRYTWAEAGRKLRSVFEELTGVSTNRAAAHAPDGTTS